MRRCVFWEVETIKLLCERHEAVWGLEVLLHIFLTWTLDDETWPGSSPRRCICGKKLTTPPPAVQWEPSCSIRTDRPDETGIFFFAILGTRLNSAGKVFESHPKILPQYLHID